jgi:hypothetical protein
VAVYSRSHSSEHGVLIDDAGEMQTPDFAVRISPERHVKMNVILLQISSPEKEEM